MLVLTFQKGHCCNLNCTQGPRSANWSTPREICHEHGNVPSCKLKRPSDMGTSNWNILKHTETKFLIVSWLFSVYFSVSPRVELHGIAIRCFAEDSCNGPDSLEDQPSHEAIRQYEPWWLMGSSKKGWPADLWHVNSDNDHKNGGCRRN